MTMPAAGQASRVAPPLQHGHCYVFGGQLWHRLAITRKRALPEPPAHHLSHFIGSRHVV